MQRHTLLLVCLALVFAGVGSATPIRYTGDAGPPPSFWHGGFLKADFSSRFDFDETRPAAIAKLSANRGGLFCDPPPPPNCNPPGDPVGPPAHAPEPASFGLIGMGLAGLVWARARRARS